MAEIDGPPKYSPSPSYLSVMNEQEEAAPDISKGLIRICPHQTLSWERFHRIANLPDIKTAESFEALTKLPRNHAVIDTMRSWFAKVTSTMHLFGPPGHDVIERNERQCYITKDFGVHFLLTNSIQYTESYESARTEEFVMFLDWIFAFGTVNILRRSKHRLAKRLEAPNIWLCAHTRINDPWLVDRAWSLVHPGDDPVDQYEAKKAGDSWTQCQNCRTMIHIEYKSDWRMPSFTIMARRYLGQGQSPDDPDWRGQCGLPSS